MGVENIERVAAAVRLWVWTWKHSSQHEELAPKHAAAVVGQGGNLPLSLGETGEGEEDVRGERAGRPNRLKTCKSHTCLHLHHGPLPGLRVQDVDVIEPLLVLGSSEHKDPPRLRVVDGCVADPGLRRRPLRQSLRRDPGHVLCWTEAKTLALTWSQGEI